MNMLQLYNSPKSYIAFSAKEIAVLACFKSNPKTILDVGKIVNILQEHNGKTIRLATTYEIITRLKDKKLLQMLIEPGSPDKSGRPPHTYKITPLGQMALDLAQEMLEFQLGDKK